MYESFAQPEIGRLDELRLEAVELRIDADLRRGLAAELIGELESLARQHPLRERFTAQLMVALYRSGRQAEALRAYRPAPVTSRRGAGHRAVGAAAGARGADRGRRPVARPSPAARRRRRSGSRSGATSCGSRWREHDSGSPIGPTSRRWDARWRSRSIGPELANDPAFIRRFEAEAELSPGSSTPISSRFTTTGGSPGRLPGHRGSSAVRPGRGGRASARSTRRRRHRWCSDLGSALALAHQPRCRPRRHHAENILIDEEGRAYLADFGIVARRPRRRRRRSPDLSGDSERSHSATPAGRMRPTGRRSRARAGAARPGSRSPGSIERADSGRRRYPDADSFVDAVRGRARAGRLRRRPRRCNPYKGLRRLRRGRCRRLLRAGAAGRAAAGAARRTRHPGPVRRPGRARAAAASRAWSTPGCCRPSAAAHSPDRPTGSLPK